MNNNFVGVIVDAGHGGVDSGAVANGLEEKDLTLQAATYMYNRLQELGIPAKMTRTDDEYLPKNERIERVLSLYDNSPNTILVANHINAGGGEGAEIVYSLRNDSTLADMALNNIGEAGQIKRKVYQRRLPENPNKDYYYILRETGNTQPILVEYGFIDNARDSQKLRNNLDDYVEGVVKAIADYTGYTYYPPGTSNGSGSGNVGDTYTVQKGDTLYKIANLFNISVADLKRFNNLTSDTLQIGQVLKLSEVSNMTGDYIVQSGDTLYAIAARFGTTVNELKRLNNLTSNTLYIGQKLIIPSGSVSPTPTPTPDNGNEEYDIYVVKKGDSLWLIANNYGISVDDLIAMNNLDNLTLQIGQQLKVPVTGSVEDNGNNSVYVVKKGDTLWSIARENGLTVDELKSINNLSSNLLTLGQQLIVKK